MTDEGLERRLAALESRLDRLETLLGAVGDKLDRAVSGLAATKTGIETWVTDYVSLRLQQLGIGELILRLRRAGRQRHGRALGGCSRSRGSGRRSPGRTGHQHHARLARRNLGLAGRRGLAGRW